MSLLTDKWLALRDIHIKTKELKGDPTSALHYKVREEQPKIIKQPTLMYPITLQEQLSKNRYSQGFVRVDWISVEMLDLRKFEKWLSHMRSLHLFVK